MSLEVNAVHNGWYGHVVEFPRLLPIRLVFEDPVDFCGLGRWSLGATEFGKLMHNGANMGVAWVLLSEVFDGVDR